MTSTYAPEIEMWKIVNSIFYHTPNGVWAPGIAFPTGTTLPTINQNPGNNDPHEGDFFLVKDANLHQLQKQGQYLQWVDLQTTANAITWCGTSVPGSGEGANFDLFIKFYSGNPNVGEVHQKIDGQWRNIGSNQMGLPLSTAAINFTDSYKTFRQANLGLLLASDDGSSPLLATDVGLVVKKDIGVGGFISTNQGALFIGHGLDTSTDIPKIVLIHADSDYFSPGYSTLYLKKRLVVTTPSLHFDDTNPGDLDLGNLTVHGSLLGNVTADTNLILSASNGSVQLQTSGWIQWGTNDTKIGRNTATRAFSGTPAVEIWGWNPQSSSYEAGVLITSGLQVDHIDSATGAGITVFDNINLSGSLYATHVYAKGSSSSGNGAHLWADTPGHFFLATHNATSPAWRIGYGNGNGGLDTSQPNVLSDGQVLTFANFTSIRTAAIYGETGASNAVLHGTADYATSAGSSSSASAIPTYSGSDPSSPPSGSIWLRTDL
jgi:hypothetical protein